MQFKDYLSTFPSIDHLSKLEIVDQQNKVIHTIPAVEGKLGSLRLYNALAVKFDGQLNSQSAAQGLIWFAEYLNDAKQNPGKHPNIDLLFDVIENKSNLQLKPVQF